VTSRAGLSERSFSRRPEVLVALSFEMNCASATLRFTTGDDTWAVTSVIECVALTAVAGGAQSRFRGSCQSRFMFQFWC
jgi:hypothetical protein